MVHAYFCTFTVYGFWLPNDPRGSGSVYVGSKDLLPYGLATKVRTRRSVAGRDIDPVVRREAKTALKYPPVRFSGLQALWVGRAFAEVLQDAECIAYACAILHDHVHLVVSRPRYSVEHLISRLKGCSTTKLDEKGLHPFQEYARVRGRLPRMWGRGDWTMYLDNLAQIGQKIRYVENNPIKEGL